MEKITIEQLGDGYFNVIQGDKYSNRVEYDEMLGLISALTMPEKRPCLHWMMTEEDHEEWIDSWTKKDNKINNK